VWNGKLKRKKNEAENGEKEKEKSPNWHNKTVKIFLYQARKCNEGNSVKNMIGIYTGDMHARINFKEIGQEETVRAI
jgi:hypothetical protein